MYELMKNKENLAYQLFLIMSQDSTRSHHPHLEVKHEPQQKKQLRLIRLALKRCQEVDMIIAVRNQSNQTFAA